MWRVRKGKMRKEVRNRKGRQGSIGKVREAKGKGRRVRDEMEEQRREGCGA